MGTSQELAATVFCVSYLEFFDLESPWLLYSRSWLDSLSHISVFLYPLCLIKVEYTHTQNLDKYFFKLCFLVCQKMASLRDYRSGIPEKKEKKRNLSIC